MILYLNHKLMIIINMKLNKDYKNHLLNVEALRELSLTGVFKYLK